MRAWWAGGSAVERVFQDLVGMTKSTMVVVNLPTRLMSLVLCLQLAGGESVGDSEPMGRTVLCGCGDSCGKDGRRPDLGLGTY